MTPKPGEQWNHLKRLESKQSDMYKLECDCGSVIELPIRFLEAKGIALESLQTCGQPSCFLHQKLKRKGKIDLLPPKRGRPPAAESSVRSSTYIPAPLVAALYQWSKKSERSFNQCLVECVREHLTRIGEL